MSDALHARTRDDERKWRDHDGDAADTTQTESAERSEQTEEELQCPECSSTDLVADSERGETVCAECGLVVDEDSIDRGPEWRAFDSAERDRKSRVGAPTTNLMHDKGLSTNIDAAPPDLERAVPDA
jgi:transcription initiation factor TFIIB